MQEQFINLCIALVKEKGWKAFSFSAVSKTHRIPFYSIYSFFSSETDFIKVLSEKSFSPEEFPGMTRKEKVFENFMSHFDRLREYDLVTALLKDPCALVHHVRKGERFFSYWGETPYEKVLLAKTYMAVFNVWIKDKTVDSSKTMAELDKNLDFLEK